MDKAKEISTLWSQIKPQIGELVRLSHEVESHYEVTADAYQRGYDEGYQHGLNDERHKKASCQYCRYTDKGEDDEPCNSCCFRYYDMFKPEEKIGVIGVGDEIETPSGLRGYVVNFTDDELVHYVSSEGRFGTMGMSAVSKTGRHFPEIAEVLARMKEEP